MLLQLLDYQLVGAKGFEPSTPCSQSRCANRTALHPEGFLKKRGKGKQSFNSEQ